jgi:NADPH:quinone reductase-like Zn-dependent oxidoreductase
MVSALALGPAISLATSRRAGLMLWWEPFKAEDVASLAQLVAAGTLKPAIDRRYPLDEVVDALRYVDDGRSRGKVVIDVAGCLP